MISTSPVDTNQHLRKKARLYRRRKVHLKEQVILLITHADIEADVVKFYNITGKNLLSFSYFNLTINPNQPVGNHMLGFAPAGHKIFKFEHLVQFHRRVGKINNSILSHKIAPSDIRTASARNRP